MGDKWQENRNMYCVVLLIDACLLLSFAMHLSSCVSLSLYIYICLCLSIYLFSLSLTPSHFFASFSMAFIEQQTFDQRRVGRSFSTNVSKNNQCPKCNLVIFKTEELVAAGAAWHKKCFTVSNGFCSQTILSYLFLSYNYLS